MTQLFKLILLLVSTLFFTNSVFGSPYSRLNFGRYTDYSQNKRCELRVSIVPTSFGPCSQPQEASVYGIPQKILTNAQERDFKWLQTHYFFQSNQDFFQRFDLYQFSAFCEHITQFDDYDEQIIKLKKQISEDKKFCKKTKRVPGFDKWGFHRKVHELARAAQEKQRLRNEQLAREKLVQEVMQDSYRDLGLLLDDYKILHEELPEEYHDRFARRSHALEQIFQGSEVWERRFYSLSSSAKLLLNDQAIDGIWWQTCYGNQLQQIIQKEFVDTVEGASRIYETTTLLIEKDLAITITQFSDVGIGYNQAGLLTNGISISDFCHEILEYIQAARNGVYAGVKNTIHAVIHPVQTSANMFKGIVVLAHFLGNVLVDVTKTGILAFVDQEQAWLRVSNRAQRIRKLYDLIQDYRNQKTGLQLTQQAIAFGTELYLMGKCLQAASNFVQRACLIAEAASAQCVGNALSPHANAIDVYFESSIEAIVDQTCTQLIQQAFQ